MLTESLIFYFKKLFTESANLKSSSEQHVLPIHANNLLKIGYLWCIKNIFSEKLNSLGKVFGHLQK